MRKFLSLFAVLAMTAVPLAAPAWAQTASFAVSGISGPAGQPFELAVPTVDVVDASLDEATIRTIFSDGIVGSADKLATLDAASITIPTITVTQKEPASPGEAPAVVVLSNVELKNVKSGIAASVSIGGVEVTSGPDRSASIGAMTAEGLDISTMLGFYGLVELQDRETLRPMYQSLSLAGGKIVDPKLACTIGPMTAGPVLARPLKISFADSSALFKRLEGNDNPTPEDIVAMVKIYVDLLSAYQAGPISMSGIDCTGTSEDGHQIALAMGGIDVDGFTPGHIPAMTVSDTNVADKTEGSVSLGSIVVRETDLSRPLELLKSVGEDLDMAWLEANARKLIPDFGGFTISDLAADVPDEESPGQRIKFTLGSFDLGLKDYVNGIPSAISAVVAGLHVDIPPGSEEAAPVLALGYDSLDLNSELTLHWDKDANNLVIDNLALSGDKAGSFKLRATLGNATPDLFSDNPDTVMAAGLMLTVKDIGIDIDDSGLFPKLWAMAAAEQNIDDATFRMAVAGMAQGMIAMSLAGNPNSQKITEAITAFVNGAPHLSISATSIDPAGLPLAEFEAAQNDPTVLLKKVDLSAESSGEPVPPLPPATAPSPEAETPPATEPEPSAETPPPPPVDETPPPPPSEETSGGKSIAK